MNKKELKELRSGLRTWLEIDTKALQDNYRTFRKVIPEECRLGVAVKSNAYGHGLVGFSQIVEDMGADWLCVDSVVEGVRLRKEGVKLPILVFYYTLPECLREAAQHNLSITLSSFEYFKALKNNTFPKKLKFHLKIDTGMHRQGFMENQLDEVLKRLKEVKNKVRFEGIYTHFYAAKNPAFPAGTREQIRQFKLWCERVKEAGYNPIRHAGASSGALLYPEAHFDMVRAGISLYGLWPSTEAGAYLSKKGIALKPVLSWKTLIAEVKKLPKGERISYDHTEELTRDSMIAILPVGYWHGFSRRLSGLGTVLIKGVECKVLGRVTMGMMMVDITDVKNPKVGDEVVLIGKSKDKEVTAYDTSSLDGTSWYETVTRINPLIKRFYL